MDQLLFRRVLTLSSYPGNYLQDNIAYKLIILYVFFKFFRQILVNRTHGNQILNSATVIVWKRSVKVHLDLLELYKSRWSRIKNKHEQVDLL